MYLRVQGWGLGVWGLGLRVYDWAHRISDLRCTAEVLGLRVQGSGFRVSRFECLK